MWFKCLKIKYDKKGAETELNRALRHTKKYRQKNKNRREQRIYYCSNCNSYHLTSRDFEEPSYIGIENREDFYKRIREKIQVNGKA